MSRQVSRGSAGEYQADERAGVARLSWRVSPETCFQGTGVLCVGDGVSVTATVLGLEQGSTCSRGERGSAETWELHPFRGAGSELVRSQII